MSENNIILKVKQQMEKLTDIKEEQQKLKGKYEILLAQLKELGFDSVEEANLIVKELNNEVENYENKLKKLSVEMDTIIDDANTQEEID
jgi:F0F1-type ATP synthase membrane subunit b/b'